MCMICALPLWFITIKTMLGFKRRNWLATGVMGWYIFIRINYFSLSLVVILDVDCFILVCRRNPVNIFCFEIIMRIPKCSLEWCFHPATTLKSGVFEPPLSPWHLTLKWSHAVVYSPRRPPIDGAYRPRRTNTSSSIALIFLFKIN